MFRAERVVHLPNTRNSLQPALQHLQPALLSEQIRAVGIHTEGRAVREIQAAVFHQIKQLRQQLLRPRLPLVERRVVRGDCRPDREGEAEQHILSDLLQVDGSDNAELQTRGPAQLQGALPRPREDSGTEGHPGPAWLRLGSEAAVLSAVQDIQCAKLHHGDEDTIEGSGVQRDNRRQKEKIDVVYKRAFVFRRQARDLPHSS